jgi:hypothetical protein
MRCKPDDRGSDPKLDAVNIFTNKDASATQVVTARSIAGTSSAIWWKGISHIISMSHRLAMTMPWRVGIVRVSHPGMSVAPHVANNDATCKKGPCLQAGDHNCIQHAHE